MALVLGLVGLVCFVATFVVDPGSDPIWLRVQLACCEVGLLLLFAAAVVAVYPVVRRRLLDGVAATLEPELAQLSEKVAKVERAVGASTDSIAATIGSGLIPALPPRQVLGTLLESIYGDHLANPDVVAAVLGGEGVWPGGRGLTISTNTTVRFTLRGNSNGTFTQTTTFSHTFRPHIEDRRFALFVTSDPSLLYSPLQACRLPLYEIFYIPQPAGFTKAVEQMPHTVEIGVRYRDRHNVLRETEHRRVKLEDVDYREWADYLTLFKEPVGPMHQLNPVDYVGKLAIFVYKLDELAEDIGSIEELWLQSATQQRVDEPFCFWQAPYPCYVDRISFDVKDFPKEGDTEYEFKPVSFAFRSTAFAAKWVAANELDDVLVHSWMLPGHGVALLWKPS